MPRPARAVRVHRQDQRCLARIDGISQMIAAGKERGRVAVTAHAEDEHVRGSQIGPLHHGLDLVRRHTLEREAAQAADFIVATAKRRQLR